MWTKNDKLRCDHCGKFMKWGDPNNDQYVDYGNSWSLEPPDPVDICPNCSNNYYNTIISDGRMHDSHWQPAEYEFKAAKKLGLKHTRNGWVKDEQTN